MARQRTRQPSEDHTAIRVISHNPAPIVDRLREAFVVLEVSRPLAARDGRRRVYVTAITPWEATS